MRLYFPSLQEVKELLAAPALFRGQAVPTDALPPAVWLEKAIAAGDCYWTMPRLFLDDESARVVGSAGFKFEPRGRRVEIGYGVSAAHRCQGYATEGVEMLTNESFASGQVDEVHATTAHSNHASRRVLEKAGFINYGSGRDADGPIFLWKKERPKQLPDPTSRSVTPPAREGAAPSASADH
jgi:RimJ/RimL family protein N-acetyltransferase